MKQLFTILLSLLLLTSIFAQPKQKQASSQAANIEINGQKFTIPLDQKEHWLRIQEKSNGKTGQLTVQTRDKNGKLVSKQYKIKTNKPGQRSYNIIEYSFNNKLNKKQTKALMEQQRKINRFFAQQQAELQKQMAENQRQINRLMREFSRPEFTPIIQPKQKTGITQADIIITAPQSADNGQKTWWQYLLDKIRK